MNQPPHAPDHRQHTLRAPIALVGIGLHTGARAALTLRPAEADAGLCFRRTDFRQGSPPVPAHWSRVVNTDWCTVLGNRQGAVVGTVEHLLAALHMAGIDNAAMDLDGPEVPIMDGSAAPFWAVLEAVGRVRQAAPRRVLEILKPVQVCDGEAFARLVPAAAFRVRVLVDFPGIGRQLADFRPGGGGFGDAIAPARTFGFLRQIEALQARGLALGGNLRNAVVFEGKEVLNAEGLRFSDEPVRHKILDVIGDLALVGAPILGRYIGYRPGHRLNHRLLARLFADRSAWRYRLPADAPALREDGPALPERRRQR